MKQLVICSDKVVILDIDNRYGEVKVNTICASTLNLKDVQNNCLCKCLEYLTSNTIISLCVLVENNLSMEIEEFVTNYSPKDFLRVWRTGKSAVMELTKALESLGYIWK